MSNENQSIQKCFRGEFGVDRPISIILYITIDVVIIIMIYVQ